jgi:hypothetical protein
LAAAVGAEVLERSAYILTYRASEFELHSCYAGAPTFEQRLLTRCGLTWTSSMIVVCMFRKPVSVMTYVLEPIGSSALAAVSCILENPDDAEKFFQRRCPALVARLRMVRICINGKSG